MSHQLSVLIAMKTRSPSESLSSTVSISNEGQVEVGRPHTLGVTSEHEILVTDILVLDAGTQQIGLTCLYKSEVY